MRKTVKKAIIPAAGLGTRFLPATKSQPKEMLPIVDKPTLQYIIEEAINSGIEEILVVTGRNKKSIEDKTDEKSSVFLNYISSKSLKDTPVEVSWTFTINAVYPLLAYKSRSSFFIPFPSLYTWMRKLLEQKN